ncbi:MAG: PilW family protein [Gammaproteobacteria bacterium]|nr:PilW family protein [Gammaproteobacteria bacterium]MBU1447276.1 PilW family protein [Gammaproteobacteria bacterium]
MKPSSSFLSRQTGFTLVEIMVGLAIGMLATLIIIQVISVFEVQKRTTTGTADAQTNGSIALYDIGRELQLAGYALMPTVNSPLECTTLTISGVADTTVPNRLTPITITDGTSDTLTIRYGNSPTGGVPIQITMGTPTAFDATVNDNFNCQTGDDAIAISADGTTCNMTAITASSSVTPTTLTLAHAVTGAELACLGKWNEVTYAVNNGNLERTVAPAAAVPLVAGIVNLQAQYGISASANSNEVTQWVNATGSPWSIPSVTQRNSIKAIRIAIVARNQKMETDNVTDVCSSTTAAAPTGLCAWAGSTSSPAPAIDLSSDTNWKRYRYRVFETTIPLRNVIWSRGTL